MCSQHADLPKRCVIYARGAGVASCFTAPTACVGGFPPSVAGARIPAGYAQTALKACGVCNSASAGATPLLTEASVAPRAHAGFG